MQKEQNRDLFTELYDEWDTNIMLMSAYLIVKEYKAHPQQYGHSLENLVPIMIVRMWKSFLGRHKRYNKVVYKQYYPADMRLLILGDNKFLDMLLSDMENGRVIGHGDEMVKERVGLGLREHGQKTKEGSQHFEYLCSLE